MVREIVNRWLNGEFQNKIAGDLGVAEGTVSKKINEERGRTPDLDSLKTLNQTLNSAGTSVIDATRAAKIVAKIEEAGVKLETKNLVGAERVFQEYGKRFVDAVEAGEKIMALEKAEGKSFQVIREEAEHLLEQVETYRKDLTDLTTKVKDMKDELGKLEDYKGLRQELKEYTTNPRQAREFVAFHKKLFSLGFNEIAAVALATELEGVRFSVEEGAKELAKAIAEYKSLHSAVTELGKKRTELDAKVEDLTLEKETLVDQIKAARTTLNRLEESVEKLRTASTTLAGAIKKAGSDAGTSMQGIVKQAKSAIAEARRKAETGLEKSGGSLDRTIMESMERLSKAAAKAEKQADKVRRDMELVARKSVDVGRVLERMEPIGRVYHFISSGKGEPNDVYKWSIDFMEQLEKWELSRAPSARTYSLRDAIKETRGNWSRSLEM